MGNHIQKATPLKDAGTPLHIHKRLDASLLQLQDTVRQLEQLKSANENILDSIEVAIMAFDGEMNVTYSNATAQKMLNPNKKFIKNVKSLLGDSGGVSVHQAMQSVLHQGQTCAAFKAECFPKKNQQMVLKISIFPLKDTCGKVSGAVLMADDVTQHVKKARRIMASERHAVMGRLAAKVAHELNTPLDAIIRYINMSLSLKKKNDPTRNYLEESKKGLERMAAIVSSLLGIARIPVYGNGNMPLLDMINEAVKTFDYRAQKQDIKITIDVDKKISQILPGELLQVFLNLIKNAYDAMGSGGELKVKATKTEENIHISFTDTGCGIKEELVSKIFEPFFTTKGPSEGTGLGLAISKDIIERCGGTIRVESSQGMGTTFTINLPFYRSERETH